MCCRKATKRLIERPKKDQTAYYSGKNGKNLTQKVGIALPKSLAAFAADCRSAST